MRVKTYQKDYSNVQRIEFTEDSNEVELIFYDGKIEFVKWENVEFISDKIKETPQPTKQ